MVSTIQVFQQFYEVGGITLPILQKRKHALGHTANKG